MKICEHIPLQPLFIVESWVPILFSGKFLLLPFYPFDDLLLIQPPKHSPQLQFPVPATKPFVGVQWEDLRVNHQYTNKTLRHWPFPHHLQASEVSPEASRGVAGTKVLQ
jgi:hypothetical protein